MKIRIAVVPGEGGRKVLCVEDGRPEGERIGGKRVAPPDTNLAIGAKAIYEWVVDADELREAIAEAEDITKLGY